MRHGPGGAASGRVLMNLHVWSRANKPDESHEQQFWRAVRVWGRRVRDQRVSLHVAKVAWALSTYFGTSHGISFAGRDTLVDASGVRDPRDVRRALQALTDAGLIEPVDPVIVAGAMRSDAERRNVGKKARVGRHPTGYRMVLSEDGEHFPPSVEAIIVRRNSVTGPNRVGSVKGPMPDETKRAFRGRRTTKSMAADTEAISWSPSPLHSWDGHPPKMMEAEGSGAPAPLTYLDASTSEIAEDVRTPEGAHTSAKEWREPVDYHTALQEIICAYRGPASQSDRRFALAAYSRLIEDGKFHSELVDLAAAHDDDTEELDRFLWRLTGLREATDDDIPF